jgi:hypothetical protein
MAQTGQPSDRSPRILSGDDIGFRVDGIDPRSGLPTGTLVVRINGDWVVASTMPSVRPPR